MVEKASRWKVKKQQIHSKSQSRVSKENDWIKANAGRRKCNAWVKNWSNGEILQLNFTEYEIRLWHWNAKTYEPIYRRKSVNQQKECSSHTINPTHQEKHAGSIGLGKEKLRSIFPIDEERIGEWNRTVIH